MSNIITESAEFFTGCDTLNDPIFIDNNHISLAHNVVMRGGVIQTRPGSRTLSNLPEGNLQGACVFYPQSSSPQILAAVDGYIYVTRHPYESWKRLDGLRFSPFSKFVEFQVCLKSVDVDGQGVPYALNNPYPTVIIQDGNTRAAFYDGINWEHLSPEPSGLSTTEPGFDGPPIGLWMEWSGNRLWVARGEQVFASDFGNPYKFTEGQYLAEGRAFYFPGEVTGMVEVTNPAGLLVFTKDTTHRLQSNITNRQLWLNTTNFQDIVFKSIGCVSKRSIVNAFGFIWWYSSGGLLNFDAALSAQSTSRIDYLDAAMSQSKMDLSNDVSKIASTTFENYVLVSVPSGSPLNRHTWILDLNPGNSKPSWNGWWTGWNPVVWLPININGVQRLFMLNRDNLGCNQLWELFVSDRTDNGMPIDCLVQTRMHNFGSGDFKTFNYAEFELCEISGDLSVLVARAGEFGSWKPICVHEISAIPGALNETDVIVGDTAIVSLRPQSRFLRTEKDDKRDTACNVCGVETTQQNATQRNWQLLFIWSGRAALRSYRIYCNVQPRDYQGECGVDESSSPRAVNVFGCGGFVRRLDTVPFPIYTSLAVETVMSFDRKQKQSAVAESFSWISQRNADIKARMSAKLKASVLLPGGLSNVLMITNNNNPYLSLVPFTNRAFDLVYVAESGGCVSGKYYT